jgi:hypothetical protein
MKKGYRRFQFYIDQISALIKNAESQENPALWLFKNNARTPFFMLEALSRLYEKIDDHKTFRKLREQFKLVEDLLGEIDYYNWLNDSLSGKKIDDIPRQFIKRKLDEGVRKFNDLLIEKGWIARGNKRIGKISRKLEKAGWPGSEKEVKCFESIYKAAVKGINSFVEATDFRFDNVEEDVHELRRRLRWLSIYPQALQGAIRYAPDPSQEPHLKKYLTQEIVNSPYNKLPESADLPVLLLDKNYFLALSWMIAQLGSLKDEGLLITGLAEAIAGTEKLNHDDALSRAADMLGMKENTMDQILRNAEEITRVYISEKNLKHLVVGKELC